PCRAHARAPPGRARPAPGRPRRLRPAARPRAGAPRPLSLPRGRRPPQYHKRPWAPGVRTHAGADGVQPRRGAMSRSDNLPRRFARIYTAAITDVMDELGLQRQTLPAAIQPLAAGMRAAGYAFTARGRPHRGTPRERDDTLRRFLKMLSAVPADSVLVLAANDSTAAHFGELSASWFR